LSLSSEEPLVDGIVRWWQARIDDRIVRPGTRLPSIRTITAQHGLSASTAFKAYYRLEEKGLVRAQPRSGYYVTASAMQQLAAPARGAADGKAGKAARVAPRPDVSELVFAVLGAAQEYPHICASEIDFLREVLPDASVERVSFMLDGAHVCAYAVRPA